MTAHLDFQYSLLYNAKYMSTILFFIFFFTIWLGPIIPGVLIAKKKNRSPHWFWLSIWPGVSFWILIIMCILKPLEKCSNCGKTIPSGSKICPFCTTAVESADKSPEEIQKSKKMKEKDS